MVKMELFYLLKECYQADRKTLDTQREILKALSTSNENLPELLQETLNETVCQLGDVIKNTCHN